MGVPVVDAAVEIVAEPQDLALGGGPFVTDAAGQVSVTVTAGSTVGAASLTASTFGVTAPASATLSVVRVSTTTQLLPPTRIAEGTQAQLEARVSAPVGRMGGQVTFLVDGQVVGTPANVDLAGHAAVQFKAPTLGHHTAEAHYLGTALFAPSEASGMAVRSVQEWEAFGGGCAAGPHDGGATTLLVLLSLVSLGLRGARRRASR
jgi:uncharacterized protein (TIGR03382 family)